MAHEIDFSTGKPAIAYVGEEPWHKLGQRLPEGQPIETWLKAAQLEWELRRLPVQYLVDGKLRTMDDRFALVRSDTGTALSIVSGDYHIVQPKEVIEFYRDLLTSHGYALETAGALNGGRKVWALARTGRTAAIDDAKSDSLAAYVLLATSCDKSLATTAAFTSVRVVCQNTLFFAINDVKEHRRPYLKVPHTLRFDPYRVKAELGLIDKAWNTFITNVKRLSEKPMKPEEASAFFTELLGEKEGKPLSPRAQREHSTVLALFGSAPGQNLATARATLWGAVNAVTYYADHIRAVDGGDRIDSAWFGSGCSLKEKVWKAAMGLVDTKS